MLTLIKFKTIKTIILIIPPKKNIPQICFQKNVVLFSMCNTNILIIKTTLSIIKLPIIDKISAIRMIPPTRGPNHEKSAYILLSSIMRILIYYIIVLFINNTKSQRLSVGFIVYFPHTMISCTFITRLLILL